MKTKEQIEEMAKKYEAHCPHEGVDAQYCLCSSKDRDSFIVGYEQAQRDAKVVELNQAKHHGYIYGEALDEIQSLKSQIELKTTDWLATCKEIDILKSREAKLMAALKSYSDAMPEDDVLHAVYRPKKELVSTSDDSHEKIYISGKAAREVLKDLGVE